MEMDHILASKLLIKQLASLGFSLSYDEVLRFKQSVVGSTDDIDIDSIERHALSSFKFQYLA